jgi:hydroxyacylglutathione hydrolase
MKHLHFDGWHLIGAFPDNEPGDVGSWLLVHSGEALLLEVPPGLSVRKVKSALKHTKTTLRCITASHSHDDHLEEETWSMLREAFPTCEFIHPASLSRDRLLHVSGEPLWLISAPKHSANDLVTVFRGVAMTGDIELGMLASVNDEVRSWTRMRSMAWLAGFQKRAGYHVHTTVSAHLNSVRTNVNWPDLFRCEAGSEIPMRMQCTRYGCWGNLVPMEMDPIGRDMKCVDCGCGAWSNPKRI